MGRDPAKVCDLLNLKVKYCEEEESRARKTYRGMKREMEKAFGSNNTKKRKMVRVVSSIAKESKEYWEREKVRTRDKCTWLQKKYTRKIPNNREAKGEDEETWIQRIARGRGPDRKRVKIEIPVYGGVVLDQDERDALSLPPKFAQYEKVRLLKLKHQQFVRDTKLRYSMKDRDFDLEGNDVTPEEEEVSVQQEVRDQEFREPYNPDKCSLDFRKLRPTDVKSNPKSYIP